MRAALMAKADNLQHVRRLVPVRRIPAVVKRRLDKLWTNPDFRAMSELQMRFLLEHTERADEVPELAYLYAEWMMQRMYLRFHPRAITHQRVEGIERLTTERDPTRGVVLNFMHHAHYNGMFASVSRLGPHIEIIMSPAIMGADSPVQMRQQARIVSSGGPAHPSNLGTEKVLELLGARHIVAIASDVPGRTPMTFLGQPVIGSFGAPRLAKETNSPVVIVTARRDASGADYLQVEEPLEPSDFDDPRDLLEEILRINGEAVLDWPEALEVPWARWNHVEDGAASATS